MTYNEVRETCKDLKNKGYKDQDIFRAFTKLYLDGTVDKPQFQMLLTILNLKMDDDFVKLAEEEQKKFIVKNWKI